MIKSISTESLLKDNASLMPEKKECNLRYMKLGELCTSISRGITISSDELMACGAVQVTDSIYIGPGVYKDYGLDFWNTPYLGKYLDDWSKAVVEAGDLLLSKTITPPKAFVMDFPEEAKVIASSNLFILKLNKAVIDPVYLMAYLHTEEGQEKLISKAKGEKRTKVIPIDAIREIEIPVIAMEEQIEQAKIFSEKIRRIRELKQELSIAEHSLGALYRKVHDPEEIIPVHAFSIMTR